MQAAITNYYTTLTQRYKRGTATEHTYRGDLQTLIETLVKDVIATNEPKRQACGAPDYIITRKDIPVGYIEAKDLGANLDSIAKSEQLKRYRGSLNNLILTNYLEFRLYREGEEVSRISIAHTEGGKLVDEKQNWDALAALLTEFCTHIGQSITGAEQLAKMMAGKARLMQDVLENALTADEEDTQKEDTALQQQYKAFKDQLIHDIKPAEFADLYAQTIAYGMFAARLHDPSLGDFSRQEAAELIPKTNPFLRKLFQYIAGYDLDERLDWIVDALADVFRAVDIKKLLKNFGRSTQTSDPIIHFYETFLKEYDPRLRKSRGVWYTPAPVVDFIVRAVDDILKTEFGLKDGLADTGKTTIKVKTQTADKRSKTGYKLVEQEVHKVQVLDPAAGTGTFLAQVIKQIHSRFKGQEGIWSDYVEKNMLSRLHGFELLMASYAMCHLQLDLLLSETGYQPKNPSRFGVYLTNSLEEAGESHINLFAQWLSNEATEANKIKNDVPVMVVLGNPPYLGESKNKGKWILELMEDYKKEPTGEKLKEKNSKWLNDDYVKFIRYGQYYIEELGEGVLAFINPHGFLDNPTFRGMRYNLLKTFDKIYTLDLHGNSKKKETAPDGSVDENVFDIQQGVSINLFIKTGKKKNTELGKVFHYDAYGKRENKYELLNKNTLKSIGYKELPNIAPNYFFVNKDFELKKIYEKGFLIKEFFSLQSAGIVTSRDNFIIDFNKGNLKTRLNDFLSIENIEEIKKKFKVKENAKWKIKHAQSVSINEDLFSVINYRPFDKRIIYYSNDFIERSREEIMSHLNNRDNIAMMTTKKVEVGDFNHVFILNGLVESHAVSLKEINYTIPLYTYPLTNGQQSIDGEVERTPNFDKKLIAQFAKGLGLTLTTEKTAQKGTFAPIDVLDYIYAVLHSPAYREKYKEFLKIDFPRVPFPTDTKKFWQLVALGSQIRQLHLLESEEVENLITTYPQSGTNEVEKPYFDEGKVWINNEQYFDGVPQTAWEFYIGGYQPAQKWLKDRKGRILSFEDIRHYQQMIVALTRTAQLMEEIDKVGVVE